ncbi:bifunctional sugar phosphate isomerase/epimerase/4-hydroxyphenylpyruvate dioxygenase family protein [Cryobacterium sp. Y82]|uniref:bifunctional sugar phosphate isomerase/epimerase/4-hydroxyphenylpyruvate dioxygenase family protein n=1 Tax=Cryobacterium sp. Y82 TaxID=2045017 RepID=UPI000CE3FB91|nr:sugar phosphate isomerase/epimerase and 4-hydroxyphenylpyruvate domain-containing protein [Cryobacterium sp. Y82]
MKTSIATVCLSGTLEDKLRACAFAGFDGVEIFEPDLVVSPSSPEDIRSLAADLGLTLDLYQPFRDFDGVSEPLLAANLRRAASKFTIMNRLGIDTMLLCSNVGTATIDNDEVSASQLQLLGAVAADHGVRVAYEALAWGKYVNDFERAQRIVDLADHAAIGTCLDSFHILSRAWSPAAIETIAAEKIFFVQLADAPLLSLDVLSWSRHHRVFPGEGDFDLPAFLAHVVRSGYRGPVSLEVFNDVFRQGDERRTAVDAMRSLIWLEERTSLLLAEQGVESYPMQLTTIPRVDDPTGFDFAEVKAENTRAVENLAFQLGFSFDGHHRTKPVQLWSQGEARIIISEQQARHLQPGIAALGFTVTDAVAAAARALALKATAVPRPNQAGEEVLQGFYAPDGTEVFLVDGSAAWTQEFTVAREKPTAPTVQTITHIDHVNLAQAWQHFDEAVLFYESTLSLAAQASMDVPGPSGLVRSQVVRTEDGRVRLALNIAPLAEEQAAAYPQHIAFACTDLVAVARQARQRGLNSMPVPPNYYEDIDARFELDPEFLATLQELDLLFDRDDRGHFLHFYTETVGSLFFEVVQRLGDYDGYGAPNAPVRLAAQHLRGTRH